MSTLSRASQQSWQNRAMQLGQCVVGIMASYMIVSYLQEKIVKQSYGGQQFTYMQCLVLAQCIVSAVVAVTIRSQTVDADNVPVQMYSACSISYVLAMLCSNLALEYVNYPTQVLAKSCKPIPILIAGVLFAHKSYPWRKYAYILMIVFGMGVLMYKPKASKSRDGDSGFSVGTGETFLLFSLAMDGITGAIQERIRHSYHMGTYACMFYMNAISSVFLAGSVLVTGEFIRFGQFMGEYPHIIGHMLLFALMSAVGQCFIFRTVTEFGPLTCSILTNLRKLFSVISSIIIFSHPYSSQEAIGALIVFAALFLDGWDSKKRHDVRTATKVEK